MSEIPWTDFLAKDAARIYRYFLGRFDRATAEDLVQEVLLRVVSKVKSGQYDPNRASLITFAFGIAHFVGKEHAVVRRKTPSLTVDRLPQFSSETGAEAEAEDAGHELADRDHRMNPEGQVAKLQRSSDLRAAIGRLPLVEQEVLALVIDEDLSIQEISTILEIPAGSVKSHIHRAKARLRQDPILME